MRSPTDGTVSSWSELVYIDGTTLQIYDLASGRSSEVRDLPSADVAVTPDGLRWVAARETHPAGPGPEGFRRPDLVMASTMAKDTPHRLGPGRSPLWSTDSTAVAAIVPRRQGEAIVVYRLPDGVHETAAPSDERWTFIGWEGTDIVAIGSRSGVVMVSSRDDTIAALHVSPSSQWGVSPAGGAHLVIGKRGPAISGTYARSITGIDGTLGDGAWSWDGRYIAATILTREGRSQLALIDATSGAVTNVPDGKGAQGNVVWAATSETFAFARIDPSARGRLQAVVCTIELHCDTAFAWRGGVRLLGFR